MAEILGLEYIKRADPGDLPAVLEELEQTRDLCKKLDEIIENTPDGIYVTDGNANAIRINPAFARISGLDREQMLGVNHRVLEKEGIVSKSSALMVVKTKKPVTIIHEYLPTNKTALVTSTPVFDENGEMTLIVSSTRDVTKLNVLQDELKEEKEKRIKYENQLEQIRAQMLSSQPIIAVDKKMIDLLYMASRIASVDSTILITGETGAGKEGIAKYIHNQSPRKDESYIVINCGAIPQNLVESELFGYEKGAFTGANSNGKPGILELAEKGTVFMDEVGELPLETQAKLLRAIESRTITRVGGIKSIRIDIRIIAATNRDLLKMVENGEFREDLYYRLNVVPIHVPPLRERRDDIIPLINYFLKEINQKYGFHKRFTNAAYKMLHQYSWPGNVRELKNVVERMAVTCERETIDENHFYWNGEKDYVVETDNLPLKERMEKIEYSILTESYEKHGSVRKAANSLQMSASTFARKKKEYEQKYGIENT